MACEINASPSNGLVQSADGSGVIKLKSNGVTTNALAWVNFNGTGTVAIRSSYNVSSITDNGTGNYTVNFTTALSDANYTATASASSIVGTTAVMVQIASNSALANVTPTTAALNIAISNWSGTLYDSVYASVVVFGN